MKWGYWGGNHNGYGGGTRGGNRWKRGIRKRGETVNNNIEKPERNGSDSLVAGLLEEGWRSISTYARGATVGGSEQEMVKGERETKRIKKETG